MGYRLGDFTKSLLKKKVQAEMRLVVENDPRVQVFGPIRQTLLHSPVIEAVQTFRSGQYASSAKYLNDANQVEIETRGEFDRRSFHFYATFDDDLAGSVRVTPFPFELVSVEPKLRSLVKGFERYLELGRLIVSDSRRSVGIGKKMLYASMLWAVSRQYEGFVAICREHRRKEFERFGMQAVGPAFKIPSRSDGTYFFLAASWCRIQTGTAKHYFVQRTKKKIARVTKPRVSCKRIEQN